MAKVSGIEWTESTWNPVTGCTKISPGCKHCYAERMAERLQLMGQANYSNGFELTLQPHMLELPLTWKKPQTIFVNSMSDLFHCDVPLSYIQKVFNVMERAEWHRFQVLTKRSDRLTELSPELDWASNIWMGVSVESAKYRRRIDDLRSTGARIKFLSLEPLLGPLPDLSLSGIDWVIVGGESGPQSRPMDAGWVTDIRDQCRQAGVPFFFKQWGGKNKKKSGRLLQGRTWDQMPRSAGSQNLRVGSEFTPLSNAILARNGSELGRESASLCFPRLFFTALKHVVEIKGDRPVLREKWTPFSPKTFQDRQADCLHFLHFRGSEALPQASARGGLGAGILPSNDGVLPRRRESSPGRVPGPHLRIGPRAAFRPADRPGGLPLRLGPQNAAGEVYTVDKVDGHGKTYRTTGRCAPT